MSGSDSAVVLEDRQRGVEVVATVYVRVHDHGPGGSRRLQGIGGDRLLAEAMGCYWGRVPPGTGRLNTKTPAGTPRCPN